MNSEAIEAVWTEFGHIRPSQKLVLARLASVADHRGRCLIDIGELAVECGKGRKQVLLDLRTLERSNAIRPVGTRRKLKRMYQIRAPGDVEDLQPKRWRQELEPSVALFADELRGDLSEDDYTEWKCRLIEWSNSGTWDEDWGPPPGEPGCRVPDRFY